jgi:membrane protease YdiL (CAAX protease family)
VTEAEAEPRERVTERAKVPGFLKVPWGLGDVAWFIVAWVGIQVVITVLLMAVAPGVPVIEQFLKGAQNGDIGASFALDLIDAGVGLGVIALYLRKYKVGWKALGWRRVNLWKAALYLAVVLVVFVVAANILLLIVSALVPGFNANQAQDNEFIGAAKTHHNLALVALVLLPPVLEETIFRGFLFPAISKRTGVIWGAVLSSVIFGLAHMQANIGIYTFLLGLLLCFMYVRTKSIVPGIVLHMLNNYLAFWAFTNK